jgi:hypothetical protein
VTYPDTVWGYVRLVLVLAAIVVGAWLQASVLWPGLAGLARRGPTDAEPAPMTPGRRVWWVVCGLVAIGCAATGLGLVGLGFWFLMVPGNDVPRLVCLIPMTCGALFLVLARAFQRMGRERWR